MQFSRYAQNIISEVAGVIVSEFIASAYTEIPRAHTVKEFPQFFEALVSVIAVAYIIVFPKGEIEKPGGIVVNKTVGKPEELARLKEIARLSVWHNLKSPYKAL